MNLRIATLLCLTGLGACSHNSPEPRQASRPTSDSDANFQPASLEGESYADGTRRSDNTSAAASADTSRAPTGNEAPPRAADATARTDAQVAREGAAPTDNARVNEREGNAATQPDNTRVNERDRSAAATTPIDQGNNRTDLDITQRIRQGVMADDSLSFTAKNVKIITTGGKVTLRGPVTTEHERAAIYAAARQVVGPNQIDNQIEVKK